MLKAGFSRVDITPPLGTDIQGYFFHRYATGVLDPLYLNAVAFSDKDTTAVIISADIIIIMMTYCDEIREYISEKTGIDKNNIMICCLHQHTSFGVRNPNDNNIMENKGYLDFLWSRFADVCKMAMDDMSDATLLTGEEEVEEKISFIRRYVMKSGAIETNPQGRYLEVERPYRKADNTVRVCRFKRDNKNDIALINFSTHADVVHGEKFSADWPGFARNFVEKNIENVSCMLTVGAQGDSNHADFTIPQYKNGYEHSRHMGEVIAKSVMSVWNKTKEESDTKIQTGITLIFNKTRTDGIDAYEEAKEFLDYSKKNNLTGGEHITKLGNAARIVKLRNATIFQKVPITVVNLGRVGFVGFGGEPFTEYVDKIREAAPDRYIIASCCTNGGEGYLPTKEAFEEGGYEAGSSPFSPELEEQCVKAALELLKK
jgi:hypothetical protein